MAFGQIMYTPSFPHSELDNYQFSNYNSTNLQLSYSTKALKDKNTLSNFDKGQNRKITGKTSNKRSKFLV